MNKLLKFEKWLYIHFNIILPSWRSYWKEYTEELQKELDETAKARFLIDSLEDAL